MLVWPMRFALAIVLSASFYAGLAPAPLLLVADNTAPRVATGQHILPKAKTGVDHDSVRPVNPNLRPTSIAPRPKPLLPKNAKTGVDDDSVRPALPPATPIR